MHYTGYPYLDQGDETTSAIPHAAHCSHPLNSYEPRATCRKERPLSGGFFLLRPWSECTKNVSARRSDNCTERKAYLARIARRAEVTSPMRGASGRQPSATQTSWRSVRC